MKERRGIDAERDAAGHLQMIVLTPNGMVGNKEPWHRRCTRARERAAADFINEVVGAVGHMQVVRLGAREGRTATSHFWLRINAWVCSARSQLMHGCSDLVLCPRGTHLAERDD